MIPTRRLLVSLLLLIPFSAARADMFPPPMPGLDFVFYWGGPAGGVVLAAVAIGLILLYRWLRHRIPAWAAILLCLFLFGAADIACYVGAVTRAGEARNREYQKREERRRQEEAARASGTAPATEPSATVP